MGERQTKPALEAIDVLVVEDDPSIGLFLGFALEEEGYTRLIANGVAQAVELIKGGLAVKVVISDIRMPQTEHAARDVNHALDQARSPAALIAYSAMVERLEDAEMRIFPAGAATRPFHKVEKPFELGNLLELIAEYAHPAENPGHTDAS